MAIGNFNDIHQDILRQAMQLIDDFATRNAELSPGLLAETARPRLDAFGTFLLATVPPTRFTHDAQRFRGQYTHVFRQRLDGALRDIQIGFIGGRKIALTAAVTATATETVTPTLSDAVSIKPGLWGVNINLVKVGNWLRRKWRSKA